MTNTSKASQLAATLTASQKSALYDATHGSTDRMSELAPLGLTTLCDYRMVVTALGLAVQEIVANDRRVN